MGSGKSYSGKKLAKLLEFDFFDTDNLIEKSTGKSISTIFEQYGEAYFRKCEYDILQIFHKNQDAVISTGGGMPCMSFNLNKMKELGMLIYLDCELDVLFKRLQNEKATRPLLTNLNSHELKQFIAQKLKERSPFYEKAHLIYSINSGQEAVADELAAYVKQFR